MPGTVVAFLVTPEVDFLSANPDSERNSKLALGWLVAVMRADRWN